MVCLYVIAVSGYKLSKLNEVLVLAKFEHTSHLLSLAIALGLFAANVKGLSTARLFKIATRFMAVAQLLLWSGCALVYNGHLDGLRPEWWGVGLRLAALISATTGVVSARVNVNADNPNPNPNTGAGIAGGAHVVHAHSHMYDPTSDIPLGMAVYFFFLISEKMVTNFLQQSKDISDKTREKYEEIRKKQDKKDN